MTRIESLLRYLIAPTVLLIVPDVAAALQATQDIIKVSVAVTERTGGLIESSIRSGLRSLGDIQLVARSESPDYVVRAVVRCEPDGDNCGSATHYAAALLLTEPFTADKLLNNLSGFNQLVDSSLRVPTSRLVALAEVASPVIEQMYVKTHELILVSWGRDVYRRAISEWIAGLDTRCFAATRLVNRSVQAYERGDTALSKRLEAEVMNLDDRVGPC